jgi:predicted SAM-dependent methyltransferase
LHITSYFKARLPKKLFVFLRDVRRYLGRVTYILNPVRGRLHILHLQILRKRQVADYFAKFPIRKLQLGAGSNDLPDWLNSEGFVPTSFTHSRKIASNYIFLDVCQRFPFEDNSVDYIFHEHVIEHLNYHQGQFMLHECFRILKPGGRIRIATPDLEMFIGVFGGKLSAERSRFLNEYVRFNSEVWSADLVHVQNNKAVFTLNHALRAWGHQFIYDYSTLSDATKTIGFVGITREEAQKSQDIHLANLELRGDFVNMFGTLIVEAIKPQSS